MNGSTDSMPRRIWGVAAGILLGAAAVTAVGLLLTAGASSPTRSARIVRQSATARSPGSAGPAASATTCGLPGDANALTTLPSDLSWTVVGGQVEPTSPAAGPFVVQDGISRCFRHDAEGALVAAVRLQAQIAQATTTTWPQASKALGPGPFTATIGAEVADALAQPPAPVDTDPPMAAVAGFQFRSYSPQTAVIALVYRTQDGALYTSDQTLQWVDDDWHLAPLGPNQVSSPQSSIRSLVGFVEWRQP